MLKHIYFITGTDTDVGKSSVSAALLHIAKEQGLRCFGLKPISSGAKLSQNQYKSVDAELLKQNASVALHDDLIAPFVFTAPISPHLAAQQQNQKLNAQRIVGVVRGALSTPASHVVIEGVGGWFVPLNNRETMVDVAIALKLPVIMVVGIKLGCINHALLTYLAIVKAGLNVAGWVANCTQPQDEFTQAVIEDIGNRLPCDLLGVVPYFANDEQIDTADLSQVLQHKQSVVEHVAQHIKWPILH